MTELEKMLAGGLYDFSDAELAEHFREGRRRVERFNRRMMRPRMPLRSER